MNRRLILGYGNVDRQDDGVAWHVLVEVYRRLGRGSSPEPDEGFLIEGVNPDFLYALQLTPEMAETAAGYDQICFVDAHTANIAADLQVTEVQAVFQSSPFTHHMTPETLLTFCQTLYQRAPHAILVSIRGYEFGFARSLSPQTQRLADQAIQHILDWLEGGITHE